MAIPVYIFTGFLESGKTTFLQETLEDPAFGSSEHTLLLLCEEGEVSYAPQKFAGGKVTILPVERQEALTPEFLSALKTQYAMGRVLIEYNGMWPMQILYDALPQDWDVFQIVTFVDSTCFASYMNNMRQLMVDKLQDPEMVIFNRCSDATDKTLLHRSVRMVNRRAMMMFERTDGSVDPDDVQAELPFDTSGQHITLSDEDFGLWYLDALENPQKYKGKTMTFKAMVCQTPRVPKGCFVPGRFGMTCCAEDISFIGFICAAQNAGALAQRSWITVTARVDVKSHEIYGGAGPWLMAQAIAPATPPKEELVYFIR